MTTETKQRIAKIQNGEVPQGYKNTKVGIAPNEWEIKKLGEVATKFDYGMNSSATEYDGKHKYIRITDIDENSRKYLFEDVVSPSDEIELKYLVQNNDVLFARTGASVGKSYLYNKSDGELYFAGFLIRVNINQDVNSYYIFANTLTKNYEKWVATTSMRSGQPGINAEEYKSYQLPIPPLDEQQKIAEILTTQDKLIELKEKLIAEKEQQKKYLMQNLLTGKKRLKGFSSEWNKVKLGDITKTFSGGTPKTDNKEYYLGCIPFIRSAEIDKNYTELSISQCGLDNSSAKEVIIGDLLYALYGANNGECAISKQNGAINQAILCLRSSEHIKYLYYFLVNGKTNIINTYLQGGQGNLSAQIVKEIKISLPPLDEQNAIAEILSTADREIELLKADLAEEKQKKKALMQLLLTGIVRV